MTAGASDLMAAEQIRLVLDHEWATRHAFD